MQIVRDSSIEDFLLEEMQNSLGDNVRDGIHISDLLSPKQAYWRKVKPLKALKHEIMYWLSGHAHESMFLHVSDLKHGEPKQWNDIWYTPDVFYNFPVELKTSRRGFVVKEGKEAESYEHYLKQLRYYCAAEDIPQGWLIVWYLVMMDENRRQTKPDYFSYRVEFTPEELQTTRDGMLVSRDMLQYAINTNDISQLPDCEEWMCIKKISHMLTKPRCITCNKDFATEWGINKHITSKSGKDKDGKKHEIVHATFENIIETRCKYAKWCKPELYEAYEAWKAKNNPPEEEGEETE